MIPITTTTITTATKYMLKFSKNKINFQTITIGSVCGNAYESNNTLELSCNERPISSIKFASFGTPQGTCGSFQKGSCESTRDTLSILQNVCKFLDVYLYYLLLM